MTVNGERRYRSRLPKQGFYRVTGLAGEKTVFRQGPPGMPAREQGSGSDKFEYQPGDLDPSWKNPADMVIRMEHFWFDEYLPIKRLDPATHAVTFTRTSQIRFTETHSSTPLASYFVDNVYEALSEPGEWYLDRTTGRLTYLPKPGEDPDHVVAVLPVLEQPVIIRGDKEKGDGRSPFDLRGAHLQRQSLGCADRNGLPGGPGLVGRGPLATAPTLVAKCGGQIL